MTDTCRATADAYLLNGEHYDTDYCPGATCPGCLPCKPQTPTGDPLTHCTARHKCSEHVPEGVITCPQCIGKTRHKVRRLVELTALLPVAAVETGRIESEAANLAGPAADPGGWSDRIVELRRRLREKHGDDFDALDAATRGLPDDDAEHPAAVLGRWQMLLEDDPRECYPVDRERITMAGAAAYLDRNLDQFAQDDEQDFALFTREVAACFGHVEAVLALAQRRETGAPCPSCEKPAPRLVMHRGLIASADEWRCPNNREHRWPDDDYRKRVDDRYLANATKLTARQIHQHYRVTEGTVRGYAAKIADDGEPLVRKRGKDWNGLTLYDVADVKAVRDGTRKEARRETA